MQQNTKSTYHKILELQAIFVSFMFLCIFKVFYSDHELLF